MQGMYKVAGLWSDLFQTEVELLSNPLLLNKNIAIANKMKHHYLTRERAPLTPVQQLQSSSALSEIQASVLSYNSTKDIPMERSVLNVVNHLLTFNERLSKVCAEDRVFYDNLCDELYAIKESELMRRSPIAAKERNKVLPYLKRLCQSFDTDKCTMHLSTLFFDHYLENLLANGNIDTPPDHNEILRIATATYLLACALREHWTDISSDSYLERASQMVTGAFTPQDIMATQLSILQTMPSGFTSMYTATEYGIFYLSNVKGAYKPQETQPPRPNSARGTPGTGNSMAGTPSTVDDYAVFNSNQRTRSQMSMHDDSDTTILPQTSAENSFESRLVSRSGLDRYSTASMRRQRTASFDSDILMTSPSMNGIDNSGALNDYLLLEMAFRYMVENGGFAFVYHCLIRWDDLYMSRNWNLFIPPSRVAAVLIFHFFVEFFGVDHRKDLLWCRRFCYRVFRMLYDCDVALWYQMFRENIRKWLATVAQSSARLGEMALLLELSGHKFRAAETCLQTFWSRLLFDYTDQGYGIEGLGNLRLRGVLTEADQLLSHD
ncbi:amine-terminal domain cyclin, putative [Babesia ovis]|uniref:Amine-terminal domain cyclin, putative n=1 Tax=Babesia ovis TaxID=5869 RepID=A0A9W5T7V3_BABOV|nr:amine-terminal domain cyclin, putative [Babesia ovis]